MRIKSKSFLMLVKVCSYFREGAKATLLLLFGTINTTEVILHPVSDGIEVNYSLYNSIFVLSHHTVRAPTYVKAEDRSINHLQ
jgi:hypothetical protein